MVVCAAYRSKRPFRLYESGVAISDTMKVLDMKLELLFLFQMNRMCLHYASILHDIPTSTQPFSSFTS